MNDSIQPHHRERAAYVYVRQSTGHQVRHNHQGRERQYELADRAAQLGFPKVVVVDDDQGKTGSGLVVRPGFQTLLGAVCGGEVGAVFALEASRLARNNHDWHHLIELCAMTDAVLEAIRPTGVQAALDALDRIESRQDEKRKSLELALEKARYEVDRTRRQYDLVDPANRLVAGELEARWNQAMEHVTGLERQLAHQAGQPPQLTEEERWRLLDLGRDLRALWNDPAASDVLKKRVLRTVVEEIVIRDDEARLHHLLAIHWKGGVHTELTVARTQPGRKANDCEKTVLSLIEELSKVCSDQATAAILNRLGYKTGAGMAWRVHSVYSARSYHRLTNHRQTGEWLTIEQASTETLVSHTVIRRLIREGTLPATQVVATTPWIIARESLALPEVQAAIAAVKQGRQLPKKDCQQAEFPL